MYQLIVDRQNSEGVFIRKDDICEIHSGKFYTWNEYNTLLKELENEQKKNEKKPEIFLTEEEIEKKEVVTNGKRTRNKNK